MEGSFVLPRKGSISDPLRIAVLISGGVLALRRSLPMRSLVLDFSELSLSWLIQTRQVA